MKSDGYVELLLRLAIPTVSLGHAKVHLFGVDELDDAQIGYSVDPSGRSLVDGEPGSWQRQWIVIAYEDGCGDPIFIDSEKEGFPVYTAIHGSGDWEPKLIATGLRNFALAMQEFATLAKGRENPVQLESNPMTPVERATLLDRIQRRNPGISTAFWEAWLGE